MLPSISLAHNTAPDEASQIANSAMLERNDRFLKEAIAIVSSGEPKALAKAALPLLLGPLQTRRKLGLRNSKCVEFWKPTVSILGNLADAYHKEGRGEVMALIEVSVRSPANAPPISWREGKA